MAMRIGFGYDIHRLIKKRKLIIGGINIPYPLGEDGHSDGDVLIHAIIDALLGAAGFADIGTQFPQTDPQYKNISSRVLLKKTIELLSKNDLCIINIDCTVIIEKPKMQPYAEKIRKNLSIDLNIPINNISFKAKTKEKMDATGRGKAVEAYSVVLID